MRIAGAPISWGVCEVPGWGFQMAPERVLSEMVELGLTATEFGPQGWLPVEPQARAEAVKAHGLTPVGSFFLAVMHDPEHDPIPAVRAELEAFRVAGGSVLVLACDSGRDGYDDRPVLDEAGWRTLYSNLDRIAEVCAEAGVKACVHPHWGTMIQNADEVERILDETSVGLCLDTGHLMAGGADPVDIVRRHPERIVIVHAKDVHKELTDKLLTGEFTWSQGIKAEMFAPIGEGDVDFATIAELLKGVGFDGYWVLEQDIMLDEDPAPGEGPKENARKSFEALQKLA